MLTMKFTIVALAAVSIFDAVIAMHSGEVVEQQDKVCIDNDWFYLNEDVTQNCLWIKNNKDRRESLCPLPDVGDNCPVTCGHCCDDRHDFRFPIGDGAPDIHGCDWLQSNDKAHCLRRFEGVEISYGCPKTCNACEAPIAFPYDQVPTEIAAIILDSGEIMMTPHVNQQQQTMAPRKSSNGKGNGLYKKLKGKSSKGSSPTNPSSGPSKGSSPSKGTSPSKGKVETSSPIQTSSVSPSALTDGPSAVATPSPTPITEGPSAVLSGRPSYIESLVPSIFPSERPTPSPTPITEGPSAVPSGRPSYIASGRPSSIDTRVPSFFPSAEPILGTGSNNPVFISSTEPSAVPGTGSNNPVFISSTEPSTVTSPRPSDITTTFRPSAIATTIGDPTIAPSSDHSASPSRCQDKDDIDYNSPIAPNTPCQFFQHANCDCMAWVVLLTHSELQDLHSSCPQSCDVPCDYVVPTGDCYDDSTYRVPCAPSVGCEFFSIAKLSCEEMKDLGFLKTEAELEDALLKCPVACEVPCKTPSASPSVSQIPSNRPSDCDLNDDPMYDFPINQKYGCEVFANSTFTCQQYEGILTPAQVQEAMNMCPESCNVPCQESRPTASPTVCKDDESYISPINPTYGCKVYCETDCNKWAPLLTDTEMQDVLSSCPLSCGLCGSTEPSMSPTKEGNPTKTPTKTLTSSPSSRPSSKPSSHPTSSPSDAPRNCADDVNYVSPINLNFGCGLYGMLDGQCDCSVWESLLTPDQVQDLYRSCRLTCNVCEAEIAIPSASPEASPSTVSMMPSNCPSISADCSARLCVGTDNTNLALSGQVSSRSESSRSNLNGTIDGNTGTSFGPNGSAFETSLLDVDIVHWWQVELSATYSIHQIKVWACSGALCEADGTQLNNVRVDIKDAALVTVASYFFLNDYGPVLDLILSLEIEGKYVIVSKITPGGVLCLSEVQVIGH